MGLHCLNCLPTRIGLFFSVIVPIHQAFIDNNPMNSEQVPKKRRSRTEIMKQIMELLQTGELSSGEVYKRLGYSGNPSKTFSNCVEKLITDGYIEYTSQKVNASDNTAYSATQRPLLQSKTAAMRSLSAVGRFI